ncbi:MAG: D-alanine-D-alanine ligase [Candidatus Azotimanducaceae bacterium]
MTFSSSRSSLSWPSSSSSSTNNCLKFEREKINNSLKIAVINGGSSPEASVSRISAIGVIEALKENYGKVLSIELNASLSLNLAQFSPDIVIPILHGPPGEDGTIQGFLEILGYHYLGSGVHASAVAMDKVVAKHIFAEAGLPLAKQLVINHSEDIPLRIEAVLEQLGESVVVKPATQGSTLGITLVSDANGLHNAIIKALEYDNKVLVEERIFGREITVGVLETDVGPIAFPVIDIVTPEDVFYDFKRKYTEGLSRHIVPADMTPEQTERLMDIAVEAHIALGCRDLSRADFIVPNDAEEILLEVNTLPGMTPTSLYPDGAKAYGLSFDSLMLHLVERVLERKNKSSKLTS